MKRARTSLPVPVSPVMRIGIGWTAALGTGVVFTLLAATLWLFIRVDEPLALIGINGDA